MNKVALLGRLTADPDIKYTQTNNVMVATFTLAVNRRFAKTEDEKKADFIYVTAWNKTAEFVSKYFKKGQQVAIAGRLEQHEWENTEGKKQSKTQVVAEEVYPIWDKKKDETIEEKNTDNFEISSDNELPFYGERI